jgi:hypothetical protein
MNEQEQLALSLEATCGPAALYSDHKPGETITYRVSRTETRSGIILFVAAPQQVMSQHVPLTYVVDSQHGFPDLVYQSDILEPPFCG